ncbi:MAG TPA: hypothetical protein VGR33_03665 [Actinomycetota bacterium]|nr:hypothetical protein [Actinomycetota bacterium]
MDRCRVVVRAAGGMGRVLRTSLTPGVADGASLAVLPPGGGGTWRRVEVKEEAR